LNFLLANVYIQVYFLLFYEKFKKVLIVKASIKSTIRNFLRRKEIQKFYKGTKYLCHDSSLEKKITERIWGKNLPANSRTSNHSRLKQSSSKKAKSSDFSAIWDHLESRRILGIPASVKQDKRHEVSAPRKTIPLSISRMPRVCHTGAEIIAARRITRIIVDREERKGERR
ncbi:hypothetical protein K0M31_001377, partial [Melipona bicolor]